MKGASKPSHGKETLKQSSKNFFRHEGCETLISIRTSLRNLITQVFTLFSQLSLLYMCGGEITEFSTLTKYIGLPITPFDSP
jgi:hypothetical protein